MQNKLSELKRTLVENNKTTFEDSFSKEIWESTYKNYKDETVDDTMFRVASAVASVEETEEKRLLWTEKFYNLLTNFKATAGGRIYANAGTGWKGTGLMNCFVGPRVKNNADSLEGILEHLKSQAFTLKSEGGWGENFSYIRPRGSFIEGVGVESPGAVKFMELFDKSSEIITAGSGKKAKSGKAKGKIRKGAMMGVLNCWHPDIIEFITAKQQPGRLTKFNISTNCSDEFMQRIVDIKEIDRLLAEEMSFDFPGEQMINNLNGQREELDKWDLIFPETTHPKYSEEWDGDISSWTAKGYPVNVYQTISTSGLWNLIMESTYNRAEPGVLFLDRANYFNPLYYAEKIASTNPCITGDTLVLTSKGHFPIKDLVGKKVEIWNGFEWSKVTPKVTGENQKILDLEFSDGSVLSCTKYHGFILNSGEKVEAKDLCVGQKLEKFNYPVIHGKLKLDNAYTRGVYCGDGSINRNSIFLYATKKPLLNHISYSSFSEHAGCNGSEDTRLCVTLSVDDLDKTFVPDASYTVKSRLDWLAGLLDTDGCDAAGHGQITSIDRKFLLSVKYMLSTLGVSSCLSIMKKAERKFMPDGKGDQKEYVCQDSWRLSIPASSTQELIRLGLNTYRLEFSHVPARKSERFIKVVAIKARKNREKFVYCFNEPKRHTGVFNGIMTAQCGEQMLAPGGVCNLSSINLTQFINEDYSDFDFEGLKLAAKTLVRFLDNVNSLTNTPLPEYEYNVKHKRRIGVGILGWGSALYMLQIKFGSADAASLRDRVMHEIAIAAYEASIDLAEEKGMFSLCIPSLHAKGPFVKSLGLSEKYRNKLLKTGIRNSSVLSIQPTGNSSIFANIASGGCEPVFMHEYVRTVIVNSVPDSIKDVTPIWYEGAWHETEMFKFAKEGDEEILKGVDASTGTVYKIDKNRGLTKEVLCEDYGVRHLKLKGRWNPNADWAATTVSMSVQDHVEDLKGFARFVDSAISKTVNVPNDYSFESFKDIYTDAYKSKYVKGITTYRSGTMTTVLAAKDEKNATVDDEEIILEDVKLLDSAPATMKTLRADAKKWYVTVVWNHEQTRPFGFFVHTNSSEKNVLTSNAVEQLEELAVKKGIPQRHIDAVTEKMRGDNNPTKVARLISLNLRHGVLIKNIVAALEKVEDVYVGSFTFQIRKFLASFIKDGEKVVGVKCEMCGSDSIVYSEGCSVCKSCGSSKCS